MSLLQTDPTLFQVEDAINFDDCLHRKGREVSLVGISIKEAYASKMNLKQGRKRKKRKKRKERSDLQSSWIGLISNSEILIDAPCFPEVLDLREMYSLAYTSNQNPKRL